MTTSIRNVSHDDGIAREVAEVYRRYAETVTRLRTIGTDEDSISEDFYLAALKVYADALLFAGAVSELSPQDKRDTLVSLATIALRWVRKARIGTSPDMPDYGAKKGSTPDDT